METSARRPASRLSALSGTALALAGLAVSASDATAGGDIDFLIGNIEVNQGVQINGTTPVIGGRSTMVRTQVRLDNPGGGLLPVDGLMTVFVDGVEASWSPVYSDNGPIMAGAVASPGIEDSTLNFLIVPPVSDDVVITVEINPLGPNYIPEPDISNNIGSTPQLDFVQQAVGDFMYSPVDYRPGGGKVPNLPDHDLVKAGVGDNFIQGCFPGGELLYRRTDAPSKLWTSSVSGSGSALNSSLAADLNLMNPKPDRIYGWIAGSLPYNGQAQLPGVSAMGNTQPIRHQRTYAHEMGHTFGFQHVSWNTNNFGVDVEHHLNITQSLPVIKSSTLKDIMSPGLLTNQAWITSTNYMNLFNSSVFQFADAADDAAPFVGPTLFVGGSVHNQTGTVELYDVFNFEDGELTQPVALGRANLVVKSWADGELVSVLPILSRTSNDEHGSCCGSSDSEVIDPLVGFTFIIPATAPGGALIDRIEIDTGAYAVDVPFELGLSPNAPVLSITSPSSPILGDNLLTLSWDASDADGDALQYYVRFSPNGGERMLPIVSSLSLTSVDVDLSTLPRMVPGKAYFEILASDGLNTTTVRTQALSWASSFDAAGGLDPHVNVMTPDSGKSFPQGATVILHAGAWDIDEHDMLDGADVTWTSDVDGPIGTGRHTFNAGLSLGTHNITVTGTDVSGAISSDVTTITITPRGLPSGDICQLDLGFGGPGSSVLSVCGGDLSTGTTADVLLSGAPASTSAFLVLGLTNSPTPFKGGQLVPVPFLDILGLTTDASGQILLANIPGGGGPVSIIAQFVLVDGAQAAGYGLSNAVQVDYLP
jgi:hypothetical protein